MKPNKNRTKGADSPQMRHRRAMARKSVFSVAKAGPEAMRRFGVQQRFGFVLMVLLALGAMVGAALLVDRRDGELIWGALGGGGLLLAGSFFLRQTARPLQFPLVLLGLSALGAGIGLLLPRGPESLALLLNPPLVVGCTLLGAAANGLWLGPERGPAFEWLAAGPWLAIGCALAWWFPAGEWALGLSGAVALVLVYCLVRATREAPPRFQPGQALFAAGDVFALAGVATFRWLLR